MTSLVTSPMTIANNCQFEIYIDTYIMRKDNNSLDLPYSKFKTRNLEVTGHSAFSAPESSKQTSKHYYGPNRYFGTD